MPDGRVQGCADSLAYASIRTALRDVSEDHRQADAHKRRTFEIAKRTGIRVFPGAHDSVDVDECL
jgi:hypothetical protein